MKPVLAAFAASLVGSVAGAGIGFGFCYQAFSRDLKQIDRRLDELGDRLQSQRDSRNDLKCTTPASERFDLPALRAELAKLVQAEFDARATHAQAPPSATANVEPQPENVAAAQLGQSLIDGAVSSGEWTDENRLEFRRLLGQMTDAQRHQVNAKLVQALNAGKIPVHGPVF